uniref:Retrotransposon gag domain-containing protein n=1 Tax=Leptobrachium leishanense TaxID=445787 RepID=A0A8C5QU56_9ANUR
MALIGSIQSFDPAAESWSSWEERLEQYMEAYYVSAAKKVAVFLTALGQTAYGTLRDLVSPDKPATRPLPELIERLQEHYNPKPLEIAECFKFYSRRQHAGEDIKTYVINFRKLAATCQFGDYLQTALRDMFVMRLYDTAIQKRLLTESVLTLNKATELASVMEMAARDAKLLNPHPETPASQGEEIFSTSVAQHTQQSLPGHPKSQQSNVSGSAAPTCYRCGNPTHNALTCKFKMLFVSFVGRLVMSGRVCRSSRSIVTATKYRAKKTLHVNTDRKVSSSDDEPFVQHVVLFRVEGSTPAIKVDVTLNGCPVSMGVGTGAAVSVISWTDFKSLGLSLYLKPTTLNLQIYSQELLRPMGYVQPLVTSGKCCKTLRLYVVRKGGPPLYGRDWIKAMGMPPLAIAQCTLLSEVDSWV